MTLSLKHKFQSAIPDAGDPTIVQPSNWNDEHALIQATATILGRVTAGDGVTEELTPAQARTLLNVADGATANSTDAFLLARANHTGTQSADTLTDGTTNKAFLATERTKLAGIATGATANSTDAFLLARANHTGTQSAATISDFSTAADLRIAAAVGVSVQAYDADLTAWAGVNPSSYSTTAAIAAAYQPLDSDLTAIAALTTTTYGRSVLTMASAATLRDSVDASTTPRSTAMVASIGDTYVNAKLYGAGSGGDDSLIAEALFAANPGCIVFFPAGTYNLNTTLDVPNNDGNRVHGAGRTTTKFLTSGNYDGIKFTAGGTQQGAGAQDFAIDGTGTRTSGYGINIEHFVARNSIRNIYVANQWRGIGLGPTDFSWFENCFIEYNYSHGVHIRTKDGAASSALQWVLDKNLSQVNTGAGFFYDGQLATGFTQASTGTISNCATFANSSYGFGAIGQSGMVLQGLRLTNCFFGEDGLAGLFLDTYGQQHLIQGGFYEIAGSRTTGRAFSVAASGLGIGIQITGNNGITNINGAHVGGNQRDGVFSQASITAISGCTIINNGVALSAGRRNGIYHFGGIMNISGGIIRNTSGTQQDYAVASVDSSNLTMTGVDVRNNNSGGLSAASPALAMVTGCRGLPTYIGEGGVAVGNPTGGAVTGAVNVAVNMLKNNTAYTNP